MQLRIPLTVAVLGAFLVGGASTGTTRASWTEQVNLPASSVTSGSMTLTGSKTPASLTLNRGQTGTVQVTANNTSPAAATNLVERITPTATWTSGISNVTLRTRPASSCTTTAQGAVLTTPGGAFTFCVNITASSSTSQSSATVTVTLAGRQMRNGYPSGWTAVNQTVTIPVTINQPVPPATPVITCGSQSGNTYSVTWPSVPGATSYRVYFALVNDDDEYAYYGPASSPYAADLSNLPSGWSVYGRIRAVNAYGESNGSNTIRLTRSGSTLTCTQVTP